MLFSSLSFLYYFLPLVLISYFLAPFRLKNLILLLASLFFYWWGEPKSISLMLITILSGYLHGLLLAKTPNKPYRLLILTSGVSTQLGLLTYFKYTTFFLTSLKALFHTTWPTPTILLPIGISFYSFQMISYLVDVYRNDAQPQKNLLDLATYLALFPQLIAGPIVRYTTIEQELRTRTHHLKDIQEGFQRFILGLGKKVLFANAFGELIQVFRASEEPTLLFYWLYAVAFTLQIYFDFSGYSDMAIGLGKIFGFHFLENFNYPFISQNITEFWRRWHLSLSSWFRDYVYIPLGGNRVSKSRWLFNLLIVWLLTGLWHGASWNFVLWGLFFAIFLIFEKLFLLAFLQKIPKPMRHFYTLLLILFSFVLFNANSLNQALIDIRSLLGMQNIPLTSIETNFYLKNYGCLFLFAILGATPIPKKWAKKAQQHFPKTIFIIEPWLFVSLLLVITAYLVDGSFNPFLYFRF